MSDPQQFFIAEAIAHARSLSMEEAVVFLRGLLQSCSDDEALAPLRNAYSVLSESDRQLELIQTGQLKLNFPQPKPHNGGNQ